MATADDDAARQFEELEALMAFYGEEKVLILKSPQQAIWKIQIQPNLTLDIKVPELYPSFASPEPSLQGPHYVLDSGTKRRLECELKEMWSQDVEVAILWAEHVRAELESDDSGQIGDKNEDESTTPCDENNDNQNTTDTNGNNLNCVDGDTTAFVPSSSKFGQPIRKFSTEALQNPVNACEIFHGPPFHPPKSGPSETMMAHVARVYSMEQVQWVWGQLLFQCEHSNRITKASHNMMAYRFFSQVDEDNNDEGQPERSVLVSDNDDDGEKGSGMKLAALLELARVDNAMVVVSRWYGGIHLGSARFKHIASVARDALEQFGFLDYSNGEQNSHGQKKKNGTDSSNSAKNSSRKR